MALIHEDVAIGEEQNAFFAAGFPQPPDDLEGGVGFARASGHHQQKTLLTFGDFLNGAVGGDALVIARFAPTAVVEIGLGNQVNLLRLTQAFPLLIKSPQVFIGGELGERQFAFDGLGQAGAVMEQKAIAIGTDGKGCVQHFGVVEGLRHAFADPKTISFRLHHGQGQIGLGVKNVIGPFGTAFDFGIFNAGRHVAANHDATVRQFDLLAKLRLQPTRLLDGGRNELGANIALAEIQFCGVRHIGSESVICQLVGKSKPLAVKPQARCDVGGNQTHNPRVVLGDADECGKRKSH